MLLVVIVVSEKAATDDIVMGKGFKAGSLVVSPLMLWRRSFLISVNIVCLAMGEALLGHGKSQIVSGEEDVMPLEENDSKRRRFRTTFSNYQVDELESAFSSTHYPDLHKRYALSL